MATVFKLMLITSTKKCIDYHDYDNYDWDDDVNVVDDDNEPRVILFVFYNDGAKNTCLRTKTIRTKEKKYNEIRI